MSAQGDELQSIIEAGEGAAGRWLLARVMTGIAGSALSALSGPIGFFVKIAVGIIVRYGDVLGFMLIDGWHNTAQGAALTAASDVRNNLPKDATDAQREQADQDEMAAFAALQGLGTLPDPGSSSSKP